VLFGPGAVHGLDDEEHQLRKSLFLDVLDPGACRGIAARVCEGWQRRAAHWSSGEPVVVYDAAVQVFGEAVLAWAGISEPEPDPVARDLARIVDGFGAVGPANVRARLARARIDRWARSWIRKARADQSTTSPLSRVACARDLEGELLDEATAAVELVNLLRPTVAVAWLAAFSAVALGQHPTWRRRLSDGFGTGDTAPAVAFAHEVRRYYPFVPVLAARARVPFDWKGFHVRPGQRVLLDVYGTDHGPDWEDPWAFRPERFLGDDPMTYAAFVPQGGDRPESGHRCPGEGVATALIVETLRALTSKEMDLVDASDQAWSLRRMPTRPPTGVRMASARRAGV
jgi:fatty-acid peroxygenase